MTTPIAPPAATSPNTSVTTSDMAKAAGLKPPAAPPPPAPKTEVTPPAAPPDAAAAKAAADKAAADAAAGKTPSWHPPKEAETPEQKAAAEKAAADKAVADAAAAAAKAAEVKLEIKLPEGVKVEQAQLDKHLALAKELGLSQAQTQKLFDTQMAGEKAALEATHRNIRETDERWAKELVQGWGADAVKNDVLAKRGWDTIDPSGALRKGLQQVGLLNWPVATNAIVEFAKRLGEDGLGAPSVGKSNKAPLSPEKELERRYKESDKARK